MAAAAGAPLYPELEPYDDGMLDVGDGQRIHWEASGNPHGKPAVDFHGGPGGAAHPVSRRFFDPDRYRIILFDQRGSGRSTPYVADPETDLAANTTWHLLRDIELLRAHLDIDRWLVFGGSWGSTLALLYAEQFPERVTELVLAAVTNTTRREIDWMYRGGVAPLLPAEWHRFRSAVPEADRDGDMLEVYHRLLGDRDPQVRRRAADEWCRWELAYVASGPEDDPFTGRFADPRYRLAFARTVTHYFLHDAWLEDRQLLRDADRLADNPGSWSTGDGTSAARSRRRGRWRGRGLDRSSWWSTRLGTATGTTRWLGRWWRRPTGSPARADRRRPPLPTADAGAGGLSRRPRRRSRPPATGAILVAGPPRA